MDENPANSRCSPLKHNIKKETHVDEQAFKFFQTSVTVFCTLCWIAETLWLEQRELRTYTAGEAQLRGGKPDVGQRVRLGSRSSMMSW